MTTPRRLQMALLLLIALASITNAAQERATDRWYTWSLRGEPCGYFHVVRKAGTTRTAPVLFNHDFQINYRGTRLSLKMQTSCRDDALFTPLRIVSRGDGDDEVGNFAADIKWTKEGGKLAATVNGRQVQKLLPHRTVTDFALFEIVRRLPFNKDKTFEFHCLEASELNLKKNNRVRYLGREEIDLRGKKTSLHKFEQETEHGRKPAQYWVNEGRELIRIVIDGRKEFLLSTEADAKRALER